jgi:hypothetical protein
MRTSMTCITSVVSSQVGVDEQDMYPDREVKFTLEQAMKAQRGGVEV